MKEIVKFNGKINAHGPNFLFNEDKLYLMDTQTIALWCWLQRLDITKKYNFLQMDSDIEYSTFRLKEFEEEIKEIDFRKITFDDFGKPFDTNEYLKVEDIMWKNSLSLLNYKYPDLLDQVHIACHSTPTDDLPFNYASYYVHEIQTWIEKIIKSENNLNCIVNIDISFFFADKIQNSDRPFHEAEKFRMLTDDYIEILGSALKECMDRIEVLLITVNPGVCGLEQGVNAAKVLLNKLNLEFPHFDS